MSLTTIKTMNGSKSISSFGNWKKSLIGVFLFLLMWALLASGIRAVSKNNILGADYYIYYTAARMYLFAGINPYSNEVAQTVQIDIMGRLAKPDEDQLAFAYPFFMLFWVIPFAWLDIPMSHALWMSLNILITITILLRVFEKSKLLGLLGFSMYPVFMGIILGNFSILICFFLLLFFDQILFGKLENRHNAILGILLSMAIGKPQLTWLIIIFSLLMSFSKRCYSLILSFVITTLLLLLASFLLMPDWLNNWLLQLQRYSEYNHTTPAYILSSLLSFIGLSPNLIFSYILMIALSVIILWFALENRLKNHLEKLHYNVIFLNIILILSIFLMPSTLSYNQIPILIGIFIGSKFYNAFYRKWITPIWLFYTITSWMGLLFPEISSFSNTNVIFPLTTSFSWLFLLWLFSKRLHKGLSYASQ